MRLRVGWTRVHQYCDFPQDCCNSTRLLLRFARSSARIGFRLCVYSMPLREVHVGLRDIGGGNGFSARLGLLRLHASNSVRPREMLVGSQTLACACSITRARIPWPRRPPAAVAVLGGGGSVPTCGRV